MKYLSLAWKYACCHFSDIPFTPASNIIELSRYICLKMCTPQYVKYLLFFSVTEPFRFLSHLTLLHHLTSGLLVFRIFFFPLWHYSPLVFPSSVPLCVQAKYWIQCHWFCLFCEIIVLIAGLLIIVYPCQYISLTLGIFPGLARQQPHVTPRIFPSLSYHMYRFNCFVRLFLNSLCRTGWPQTAIMLPQSCECRDTDMCQHTQVLDLSRNWKLLYSMNKGWWI